MSSISTAGNHANIKKSQPTDSIGSTANFKMLTGTLINSVGFERGFLGITYPSAKALPKTK